LLQNELNSDFARSTTPNQICHAANKVVAGCEKLLQKVVGSSTFFVTNSLHVARFTGQKQTRFPASDVIPVYGVTAA